jgi:plasmid stability protein
VASTTIRNLGDKLKARLRVRAAQHGRSMEEEARDILQSALAVEPTRNRSLVAAIRARIEPLEVSNWKSKLASRCASLSSSIDDRPR